MDTFLHIRQIKVGTFFGVLLFFFAQGVTEAAQRFRQPPSDISVIQEQTAILRCSIDDLKGAVQWTKGGFALGFSRDIPGYPRYEMVGSEAQHEYDLMITSVQLSDDDEFQCQVGPAGGDPPLLGKATVTVLIPPENPSITNYSDGAEVKIPHDQEQVILECNSLNGKPAPVLEWYKNDEKITDGVVYTVEEIEGSKLQNAKSVLTFAPQSDDDKAVYKCSAKNDALPQALTTSITLAVLHPPGEPVITGYTNGQVVQTGDTVELKCKSRGGNPLAQVYWYKNGAEIDFSFTIAGDVVENILVFTVQPDDMNAIYRCEVSNLVTQAPLKAEVNMTVWFAPESVKITGHELAKAGEEKTLTCTSAISNPAATITWFKRGRPVEAFKTKADASPEGGFITTSKIKVTLTDDDDKVIYQCHATNEQLARNNPVIDTVTLQVMYPPQPPVITGYTSGRKVTAGEIQTMLCTAIGGNPLATVTWWKGDKELTGAPTIAGDIVRNQVSFILKPDDNLSSYKCKASNEATAEPLETEVTLHVNFPPTTLEISTDPEQIKAGEQVVITCKSSSSNPASTVTWWKDGQTIPGQDGGVVDAAYGGKSTLSHLTLTPTADEHGDIYACQASNVLIERAVSDAVTLDVRSSPRFPSDIANSTTLQEGSALVINFTARGNPTEIEYQWYKGSKEYTFKNGITPQQGGAVLDITDIKRSHSGVYRLVAKNEEGEREIKWYLSVQYPATVTGITDNTTLEQGQNVTLECQVSANPLTDTTITWVREGYDMSRVTIETEGDTSKLTLRGATKDDSGEFICTANNGIGEPDKKKAVVIVKFAPMIQRGNLKAAADVGSDARLPCIALGAPEINFTWTKDDTELEMDLDGRYSMKLENDGVVKYTSTLIVRDSNKDDHGAYTCTAMNELGQDSAQVTLDGTSKPDPPSDVRFVNATHNSITLSWTPGFNGGAPQNYQVRYQEVGAEGDSAGYKYEDVTPSDSTVFTVKNLKLATEYKIRVRGINQHGESGFSADEVDAHTSAIAPRAEVKKPDDTPLIIILTVSIIGMLLLGLNVLLILFFIRRRKKSLEKDVPDGNHGNTVEMFNAPTITEDSKSYTSYGARSFEDYPDEFYKPYEDEDERRKFLPPPHSYMGHDGPYPVGKTPPNIYQAVPDYRSLPRGAAPGMAPSEAGSRGGIIMDDHDAMAQGLGPSNSHLALGPYSNASLPRPAPQQQGSLRRSQPNLSPYGPSSQLYGSSLPRNGVIKPVPLPRGQYGDVTQPPVPSRNYDSADIPRYGPAPGSKYSTLQRGNSGGGMGNGTLPKQNYPHRTPPEMRGHLV